MAKLNQLIGEFRNELGADFISTDVVGMDGMSIAGGSIDPNFDAAEASARFTTVMKVAAKVSAKIGMGKVDDNLVTTNKTYIISRFLGNGSFYWVVVVTRNATLGTVRMLMKEYEGQLWDAIPNEAKNPVVIPPAEKPLSTASQSTQPVPVIPTPVQPAAPAPVIPTPVTHAPATPAPITPAPVEPLPAPSPAPVQAQAAPEPEKPPEQPPAKEKPKMPIFRTPYGFP